jgi:hypothetical protein
MIDLQAVLTALAARLATVPDLNAYDHFPGEINLPAGIAAPAAEQFLIFDTSTGSADLALRVLLYVATAETQLAQQKLMGYLVGSGTQSVRAAVNGTLGGTVDYAVCTHATKYGLHDYAGKQYYGCELQVLVGVQDT